jgi:hypothetical protein
MNVHLPAPRRGWPARLVILAVVVVVLALAAATFVLSYSGVHEIALQAGVSARLARVYPGTFDAVLVIACVAAVVLRDARWWARSYAWLSIVVVVAVVGAADAAHAMNVVLRHRDMEGVVAAAPWVLALLGFSLLLTILRQTRAQHAASALAKQPAPLPAADEQVPTLVVPALPAPVTGQADVRRPGEDVAPGQDTAAETYPAPQAYPAAEAFAGPAADSAESAAPALSWHAYWDTDEGTGPAPQGSPNPATEAPQQGNPGEEAAGDLSHDSYPAGAAEESYQTAGADSADRYPAAETRADEPGYPSAGAGPVDDDAPPFATAPFATVPRLNRVRSTPTPPEADEE